MQCNAFSHSPLKHSAEFSISEGKEQLTDLSLGQKSLAGQIHICSPQYMCNSLHRMETEPLSPQAQSLFLLSEIVIECPEEYLKTWYLYLIRVISQVKKDHHLIIGIGQNATKQNGILTHLLSLNESTYLLTYF